ncbi:hypothetical protein ACFY1L_09070 [Streptomyces sp. NPDC001663]|uniref:hypothetical protein n=1 Tax=Streptomyces sp. NPDC001663 TaxID=3364597 RepID=UPI0036CAD632
MEACGCGEEHIPWMLAKFGLLGTAGLFLGLLVAMILTGWLLVLAVSLYQRWRHPPVSVEFEETSQDSLGGFTWRTHEPE